MNDLLRGRRACVASIACSAIFLTFELGVRAYACALAQATLLAAAVALLMRFNRMIAKLEAALPPPATHAQRSQP